MRPADDSGTSHDRKRPALPMALVAGILLLGLVLALGSAGCSRGADVTTTTITGQPDETTTTEASEDGGTTESTAAEEETTTSVTEEETSSTDTSTTEG